MNITHADWGVESERYWSGAVKSQQNPLAVWKEHFQAWLGYLSEFRTAEKDFFFPKADDLLAQRFHRGWLCDLLSSGERLASDLMTSHLVEETKKAEQLRFLDSHLNNLRMTYETWHSLEKPKEEINPLAEFLK